MSDTAGTPLDGLVAIPDFHERAPRPGPKQRRKRVTSGKVYVFRDDDGDTFVGKPRPGIAPSAMVSPSEADEYLPERGASRASVAERINEMYPAFQRFITPRGE